MLDIREFCDESDLLGTIPVDLKEGTHRRHTMVMTTAQASYLLAIDGETGRARPYLARLYTYPQPGEREPWPLFESAHCASPEAAAAAALAALWAHESQTWEARREHGRRAQTAYH